MTQDEIIRMALEAGLIHKRGNLDVVQHSITQIERFAALVRAEYEAPLNLAGEALNRVINDWVSLDDLPFEDGEMPALDCARKALAAIREALAEPVKQEPVMDYEYICALREGEQHQSEDSYFFVRPENDTPTSRKMFCQGFERGFHKGLKYAAPVRTKDLTEDEIMDLVRDECVDMRWPSTPLFIARAVIAADREKNK